MKRKNSYSKRHYSMITLVVLFVFDAANVAITNSVQALKLVMEALRTKSLSLADLYNLVSQDLKGFARQKAQVRQSLTQLAISILKPVKAYGISIDDQNLVANCSVTKSFFKNLTDTDFISKMQFSISLIAPLVTANKLVDYNITQDEIDEWNDLTDSFNSMVQSPINKYKNKKQLNGDIQTQLREAVTYMNDVCDSTVERLNISNSAYVTGYFDRRKLHNTSRHTLLRASAQTEAGMPLYKVSVSIADTSLSGITNLQGNCNIEKVPHGVHDITATYGKQTVTQKNVEFKLGKSVTIKFTLAPEGFTIPEIVEQPEQENA